MALGHAPLTLFVELDDLVAVAVQLLWGQSHVVFPVVGLHFFTPHQQTVLVQVCYPIASSLADFHPTRRPWHFVYMAKHPRDLTALELTDLVGGFNLAELHLLFGDAAQLDTLQVVVFFLVGCCAFFHLKLQDFFFFVLLNFEATS